MKLIDLSQPIFDGCPNCPSHPPVRSEIILDHPTAGWRLEKLTLALSVGLIMGGAVGNAIDRIRLGAVTDFLDFASLHFPWVFNVADSAISVGSLILVWDLFLAPRKRAGA